MSQQSSRLEQPGMKSLDQQIMYVLGSRHEHNYEQEYEDLKYLALVTFEPEIIEESEKLQKQIDSYLSIENSTNHVHDPLDNMARNQRRYEYLKRQNYLYFKMLMLQCKKHGITVKASFVPVGKEIGY